MVFSHADFVLVAAFSNVIELFAKDQVVRGSFVFIHVHLNRRPVVYGGSDIDGWLHARLREGDGRMAGHGVVSGDVPQRQRLRRWRYKSGVYRIARVPGKPRRLMGRVYWDRNIVSC